MIISPLVVEGNKGDELNATCPVVFGIFIHLLADSNPHSSRQQFFCNAAAKAAAPASCFGRLVNRFPKEVVCDIYVYIYIHLEPQTTIYKWLFQLDDSKSLYRKWLFHQTSIYKWLFGVPGICIYIYTHILPRKLQQDPLNGPLNLSI